MREVVIVSAVRTPVASYGGGLKTVSAADLGAKVIAEALKRVGVSGEQVDEVIFGNVLGAGLGQNVARQCSIKAGIPIEVPSYTINKVCGSGLKSVGLAMQMIRAEEADIVVAGGTENMSMAPYVMDKARWGMRMGDGKITDAMIKDGLWCAFNNYHMGITAENIADQYNLSREELDEFALASQEKAIAAIKDGKFKDEILPVEIPQRKGDPVIFDTDEHPRATTLEKLSKLKPAFKKDGVVTAGNASGINDGAAAVVVMSAEKAQELGIKPMAIIKSFGAGGVDPSVMGLGPIPATKKALAKANVTVADLDIVEANEAFAAQAVAVGKELGFSADKLNPSGGAIALGHPIGASGNRILVTLLHGLKRTKGGLGLATLCIGGGQGAALLVQNVAE